MMSTLSSSDGAMFTAASVMISASGWAGTSMTKQWLMRRSVRMPPSRATTAPISSSVCRLPFISASARPSRTSSTALAAAAWLCGTSTIGKPAMSRSACRARLPDLGCADRPGSARSARAWRLRWRLRSRPDRRDARRRSGSAGSFVPARSAPDISWCGAVACTLSMLMPPAPRAPCARPCRRGRPGVEDRLDAAQPCLHFGFGVPCTCDSSRSRLSAAA